MEERAAQRIAELPPKVISLAEHDEEIGRIIQHEANQPSWDVVRVLTKCLEHVSVAKAKLFVAWRRDRLAA